MNSQIIICEGALNKEVLDSLLSEGFDAVYLLEDAGMASVAAHLLAPVYAFVPLENRLRLSAGEEHKDLTSLIQILDWFLARNATRHSLLLVAGGGALLDMGGFAAAIYKRGMHTAYIPTTLMAMVDASVGGKTAIDYKGIKNLIGAVALPHMVIIDPAFLSTLDRREVVAGYWELVKHALLSGETSWKSLLSFNPVENGVCWSDVIRESVAIKERYVTEDLFDNGIRQYLNLGHTLGHAFEAFSHSVAQEDRSPLRHGEAVSMGLICELYLSHRRFLFPLQIVRSLVTLAKEMQSPYLFSCKEYERLIEYMRADKKNKGGEIAVIGLKELGKPIKMYVSEEEIKESFDFYREIFGQ